MGRKPTKRQSLSKIELRRIRAGAELELRRQGISRRERKIAAEHPHLISLVESEFASEGDTAH